MPNVLCIFANGSALVCLAENLRRDITDEIHQRKRPFTIIPTNYRARCCITDIWLRP